MYAISWRQVPTEEAWLKPRENWDPRLVWVLRDFLANEARWNTRETNPRDNKWFTFWSPRFFVIKDGEIIATDTGVNGWTHGIQPVLKALTGS